MSATFKRDDGWVVTSYELVEQFDDHDWNGDGDRDDHVAAYYAVNPVSGSCRQGVNGGVFGLYPKNSGYVLTPHFTSESGDNRDWNADGDEWDRVLLWHDINSTWYLKGRIYTSFTFTAPVPSFGFGFWGMYAAHGPLNTFPLRFGGSYTQYMGMYGYRTYFWVTSDEDGNPQTELPLYLVTNGRTNGNVGGRCMVISAIEHEVAIDVNGDGDYQDPITGIFCPGKNGGGGRWVIDPELPFGSSYWKDLGYVYFAPADFVVEDSQGQVALPFFAYEHAYGGVDVDLNGNLTLDRVYIHLSYLFTMQ
jgi:hypothetical protein